MKIPFYSALAVSVLLGVSNVDARERDRGRDRDRSDRRESRMERREERRDDRDHDHDRGYSERSRSRTVYVVQNNRPVRRVVYVNPGGGYYYLAGGRRVILRDRYYTSYPSRYFYPDGRRRSGITITF